MFEDSFYVVSLSDGFILANTGGQTGWLRGSYTGEAKDIVIPASIDGTSIFSIYQDVFSAKGLVAVDFDENSTIQRIHARAFANNSLTTIDLPDTINRIDFWAFKNNNFTEIKLPANLGIIEGNAFVGNDLTKITIGSKVSLIGTGALGEHTEEFKAAYATNGVGTYVWDGENWIHQ
jgi:hypothetical protein